MSNLLALSTLTLALLATQTAAPTPQAAVPAAPASTAPAEDPAVTALARSIYSQMRAGKVDPALLSQQMNDALTPAVLAEKKPVFDQLGDPLKLTVQQTDKLAEGTRYTYLAEFATAQLHVQIFIDKEGKVGGYLLTP